MSDRTIRILLIEDDAGDARFIRQALADATSAYLAAPSFDLMRARRLASGLKRLAPGRFDVLLLDLSLPDSRGLDALIAAQARAPQTPVIVLSDVEDRELALEAMQKGAQDCLVKGELSGSLLARAICYAIERKRAEETYQTLVERSLQGLVIVQDFRVVFANNAFAEILGYTVEELLSLSAEQAPVIVHPEDRALVLGRLRHRLAGKPAPPRYEYRGIRKDGTVCWLEMFASRIEYGGKPAVQAAVIDITARKRAEEALHYRLEFERLITGLSTRFINLAPDEIDNAINDALKAIGEFTGVDRSYVFLYSDDGKTMNNTHEWCAVGIEPQIERLKGLPTAVFRWLSEKVKRLESLHVPRVADLPPEAGVEKKEFQAEGIQSLILVPIVYGGTALGFLGLDSVRAEKTWPEDVVALLRIVGEVFASALVRRRTEETLREREALLNESQAIAHVGSWELDVVANRLTWSDEVYRIFGLRPQEFGATYEAFLDTVHPDDRAAVDAVYSGSLREGRDTYEIEHRIIRRDNGEVRIVHEKCNHVKDASGRIVRSIGMVQDITERRQAEEALRESERFLRDVFEAIQDGISVLDTDLNVVQTNRWMERMYAHHMPLVGRKCYQVYQQRQSPCPWCPSLRTIETGETQVEIVPYPSADNPTRWIELSAFPVKDEQGHVTKVIEHVKDITEQVRAEEALRKSEARYRAVVDSQVDLISRYLPDTTLTFVNDAYCRFYGKTREELIGQSFLTMIAPEFRELVRKETEDLAKNPRPLAGEYLNYRYDGKECWIQWVVQCISDESGQVVELQAVGRDITARKHAEEALKRERDLVRRIMETSPAGIVIVNREGRITFANTRAEQVLGLTRAEIGERTYNDPRWRITDYDGDPFPDEELPFRRVMATGRPVFDVRHAIEWPDGRRVLLSINAAPLFDEQGRVDGMVATVEDVTDRVRAEQALREESSFRSTIIKNAAEGLCVCHAVPEYPYVAFTVWNDRMTEITGYTMEEINRLGWYQMMYPDPEVQQRAVERMARMRVGEDLVAEEWTITRADGEKRTLLISTSILESADQEVHVLAVMQDITERKQAEAERERLLAQVQEQAQQVREIMDTVPEGVLLLDSDYRVVLANPLGKRDLATLANAQVGDMLTHLGDRPLVELLTSPPKGLWHEVVTDSRFFQVLARPIENGPTPKGWVLVIRDMTQQREAERRAQQQERLAAVGQLAAGIAHDFNNIMAVIALYAGMLAQTPDLPPKAYERLQTVKEQAQRATDLIQQILDFSRRAVLERRPMDLLPFLKEQARLLERTLPESIKIELVYGKDDYTVNADPTRMQQAIMNLALNARDAMPEGGRLRIGLERGRFEDAKQTPLPDMPPGEWIAISVSDTGVGIPPDVLPRIFEPFFTTKAAGEGTGLGLAQVYGIVSQHEGHIDVKTEVGAGTTLTLYLPALVVPRPESPAFEMERVPQGQGEIILVVEDNAAARQAIVSSLEMLGYRTLQAANGQEALAVFEQHAGEISLVLSDVVMPEMGGRALLQALRARDPQVRVVMLSGHPLGDELAGLREQGLTGWMLKPFSVEQLAEVVAQALKDK